MLALSINYCAGHVLTFYLAALGFFWLQIGAYDQQIWEKSLEQAELKVGCKHREVMWQEVVLSWEILMKPGPLIQILRKAVSV